MPDPRKPRYERPKVEEEDADSIYSIEPTGRSGNTNASQVSTSTSTNRYQPAFLTQVDKLASIFAPSAGYKEAFEVLHSGLKRRSRRYENTHSLYRRREESSARFEYSEKVSDGVKWLKALQYAHSQYKSRMPTSEQVEHVGKAMGMRGDERELMLSKAAEVESWMAGVIDDADKSWRSRDTYGQSRFGDSWKSHFQAK